MAEQATPAARGYYPGHGSRRENASVSSTHSGATPAAPAAPRGTGSRSRGNPAVESAVTRLLVSIKQLLEALTLWSESKNDENQVSDVYVRLGNDFNAAVAAFAAFNIDMSELVNVPDDLRSVLEECLSEDANPTNLNKYLPTVRQIITNLLQGLRGKQTIYRRVVSEHKKGSSSSSSVGGHDRTDSRSARPERPSSTRISSGRGGPEERPGDAQGRRGAAPSTARSRRKESGSFGALPQLPTSDSEEFVGGFSPSLAGPASAFTDSPQTPVRTSDPPPAAALPPPGPNGAAFRTPSPADGLYGRDAPQPSHPPEPASPPAPPLQTAPASMKRWSLIDGPVQSPSTPVGPSVVVVPDSPADMPSSPPLDSAPLDGPSTPAMANSLAALKKSDALERRASKRFSTYNISKMTGMGSLRGPSGGSGVSSGGGGSRRSMAASNALTAGELAVLTEADEQELGEPVVLQRKSSTSRSRGTSPYAPPVPPLPKSVSPVPEPPTEAPAFSKAVNGAPERAAARPKSGSESPERGLSEPMSVFLQVGREVKKVTIEQGLSFSVLRMLFLDKFSYNPGQDNFPAIYIRDPASGVQYELEDVDEVKDKCLLSLNIEPLDQIKQHIDTQIASLSQDIKDLKSSVTSTRRLSQHPPVLSSPFEETPPARRPSDHQLANVARRLSRIVGDDSPMRPHLLPQMTGQSQLSLQPQITGSSVMSEYTSRIVTDLRTQFDEVQNLRRDLGILRQLYTEFMKQTKDALGGLRTQTQGVRQLATAKVGGARAYIVSGKASLDSRSQNVLTKIEELQDMVENVKEDVIKKHVTPKPAVLRAIKADVDTVSAELEALSEHIKTVKPMWKKTWAEELQNIVEEQQFLRHQEEFLADLQDDHKAVLEVYGHVEKVISIRGTGSARGRGRGAFKGLPPRDDREAGGGSSGAGLNSILSEIRGAAVDPERRMKAIAASQKTREKELATRSDEFERELSGFVGGKKLKMTGGAEEADRVRQKKNDLTLKAMFTGGTGSSAGTGSMPPTPGGYDGTLGSP